MTPSDPSFIVGIGGSAGALDAFKSLLIALPANTGMAFVIIYHIHPAADSHLTKILSRCTKMPVLKAATAMPIEANHVYVIPGDADLTIEDRSFKVVSPRMSRNVQVDLLFTSLAKEMGLRAIGIVLSGYSHDGSEGCRQIKAKGGRTFAQDKSAEIYFMPLNAQTSGYVDFVLSPEKISDKLKILALLPLELR